MKKLGIVLLVVLTGCVTINEDGNNGDGGGATGKSGVVAKRKAVDFSPAEKTSFCDWVAAETEKEEGIYTCTGGNEVEITAVTSGECDAYLAQNPNCEVSKIEACSVLLLENPCTDDFSACEALNDCVAGTGNNNTGTGNNNTGTGNNNTGTGNNSTTTEFCYDHTFNDQATGKQCFATRTAYCASLCDETNPISVRACESECEE